MNPIAVSPHNGHFSRNAFFPAWRRMRHGAARRQQGISLFVVLVVVLLSTLLAMWSFRSAWLNQFVVSNDADYARAFEAAQTLMQDAELDVMGLQADGQPCQKNPSNLEICRRNSATVHMPDEKKDFTPLMTALAGQPTKCQFGICQKRTGVQDFWNLDATLTPMLAVGARYGQYTGATRAGGPGNNPLLNETAAGKGGWYWVEVMRYVEDDSPLMSPSLVKTNSVAYAPMETLPFVYRITVLVRGNKPGTQVVLQSVVLQQRRP